MSESLRKAAAILGRQGGLATSPAKARAARENGRRPKKKTAGRKKPLDTKEAKR